MRISMNNKNVFGKMFFLFYKIVDDCLNLARGNYVDIRFAMSLLSYLENESSYLPWKAAFTNLESMARRFDSTEVLTYQVKSFVKVRTKILNRKNF